MAWHQQSTSIDRMLDGPHACKAPTCSWTHFHRCSMQSSSSNPSFLIKLIQSGSLHRTDEERMICSASCAHEPLYLRRTPQDFRPLSAAEANSAHQGILLDGFASLSELRLSS